MSMTMSQQVTFTNILSLSVVQSKLTKNFQVIFKNFDRINQRIDQLNQRFQQNNNLITSQFLQTHASIKQKQQFSLSKINDIETSIEQMKQNQSHLQCQITTTNGNLAEQKMSISILQDFKIEMQNERKITKSQLKNLAEGFSNHSVNLAQLTNQLQKKVQKQEFNKLRKDFTSLSVRVQIGQQKSKQNTQKMKILQEKQHDLNETHNESILTHDQSHLTDKVQKSKKSAVLDNKIRQKIQQIQAKLTAISHQSIKINQKCNQEISILSQRLHTFKMSFDDFRESSQKKNQTEDNIDERINILTVGFNQNQFRIDKFQQEFLVQRKYFQKAQAQTDNLTMLLKQLNIKKISQQIKLIQIQSNLQHKTLEEKLQKKVDFLEMKDKISAVLDTIASIQQEIRTKADRVGVKKALLFFENKLKDIILIIQSKESVQKQSLVSRKGVFCLSCQKNNQKITLGGNIINEKIQIFRGGQRSPHGRFGLTYSLRKNLQTGKDMTLSQIHRQHQD